MKWSVLLFMMAVLAGSAAAELQIRELLKFVYPAQFGKAGEPLEIKVWGKDRIVVEHANERLFFEPAWIRKLAENEGGCGVHMADDAVRLVGDVEGHVLCDKFFNAMQA